MPRLALNEVSKSKGRIHTTAEGNYLETKLTYKERKRRKVRKKMARISRRNNR